VLTAVGLRVTRKSVGDCCNIAGTPKVGAIGGSNMKSPRCSAISRGCGEDSSLTAHPPIRFD
jgi:hypothetical protein